MFHSHALHTQAEAILRRAAPRLGEGYTFREYNPICAIGMLAREAGFIPLDEPDAPHTTAGSDVVRRVYGLTEGEVRKIMEVNDAGGAERMEKLAAALRSFCPVCTRLDGRGERRVAKLLREEKPA